MKKLNLFAVGLIAMLTASSVNAQVTTTTTGSGTIVTGLVETEADLKACLTADEATCKVTKDVTLTANVSVKGNVEITFDTDKTVRINSPYSITILKDAKLAVTDGKISGGISNIFTVNAGGELKVKDTELTGNTTKYNKYWYEAVIAVMADNTDAKTTVDVDATVTGYKGLVVYPANISNDGHVDKAAKNVDVTVNGKWNTESYTVQVQGNVNPGENVNVTVAGGEYTSKDIALYAAGEGNWTVANGKFNAYIPFLIKDGNVTINNGEFIADKSATLTGNVADANSKPAAVLVLANAGYSDNSSAKGIELTIKDGTFKSTNYAALAIEKNNSDDNRIEKIVVEKGNFEGKTEAVKTDLSTNDTKKAVSFIKGGSFKGTVDEKLIASHYTAVENNDVIFVGKSADVKKLTIAKITNNSGEAIPNLNLAEKEDGGINPIELFEGNVLDLNKNFSFDTENYTVTYKITAGDATITNGVLTMGSKDSTIEIVVEPWRELTEEDLKPVVGPDVTPSTPGTDPTPGEPTNPDEPGREPEAGEKDPSEELPKNQPTGDNVMGSVAMGIAGLVGIVGSALVFDKKTNYNN